MGKYDWEKYDLIIEQAFFELLNETKKIPTQAAIAKRAGVSRLTVQTHMKEKNLSQLLPKFKMFTAQVLKSLSLNAIESGKAPEIKLFMQLVESWKESWKESNETKIILDKEQLKKDLESFFE